MSQKVIILLLVAVLLIGGIVYFSFLRIPPEKGTIPPSSTKSAIEIPSSPTKLDVSGAELPPADQALVEITVLSQISDDEWQIRIDEIRDYIRYPAATNPQLKVGDTLSIPFNGWLDTFQYIDKVCPAGYIKSPKPIQTEPVDQPPSARPQPEINVGEKYLSKLFGCFTEIGFTCPNKRPGWSGWLYNSYPIIIEYECVKPGTLPSPPPVEPQ